MAVDRATVKRVASLARIELDEAEAEVILPQFNAILTFVEQLDEVDVSRVEPMTTALEQASPMRGDEVVDGAYPDKVLANAPAAEEGFFLVPKVIE